MCPAFSLTIYTNNKNQKDIINGFYDRYVVSPQKPEQTTKNDEIKTRMWVFIHDSG